MEYHYILNISFYFFTESYSPEIVFELSSNTTSDMETNAEKITQWIQQYKDKSSTGMQM